MPTMHIEVQPSHCPHADERFRGIDPSELLNLARPEENQFSYFAEPWLGRATSSSKSKSWFEALIYLWISFNAWMGLAVNDRKYSENDSYLWKSTTQYPNFIQRFSQQLESNRDFSTLVNEFRNIWPVFKVRALIDNKIPPWGMQDKDETRSQYRIMALSRNSDYHDFSPSCFLEHQINPNEIDSVQTDRIPLDWEHTLAGIYMVRCNLFHGGKSFLSSNDTIFVSMSYRILSNIWWGRIIES
jgi:hypothetical protein